jgi:Spy/CpxP family protein refolding chaperone
MIAVAIVAAAALATATVVNAQRPGGAGRGAMMTGQQMAGPRGAGPAPGRGGMGQRGMGPGMMGRGGPGAGGQDMLPPFAGALGLTDEQRAKAETLARAARDQAAPIRDELELAHKNLHREAFADKRDDKKLADLTAKVATLERQLLDAHVKAQTAFADVLTATQREIARVAPGGPHGPMGRMGGRGGGGGNNQ